MIDEYTPLGHVGFVSWAVQIATTFQQSPKSTLVKKTRKQAIKCMLTLGKNIALHNNHKPDMTYEFFQLSIIPLFVECHYYLDIFHQSNQISFQNQIS